MTTATKRSLALLAAGALALAIGSAHVPRSERFAGFTGFSPVNVGTTGIGGGGGGGLASVTTSGAGLSGNGTGGFPLVNSGVTSAVAGTGVGVSGATGAVTFSNTGVTSNVAGTGIGVSGATGAVTITNNGVTSAVAGTGVGVSGATGSVTFSNTGVTSNVAGTGIGLSGGTGAVTITNSGVTSAVAGTGMGVSGATGAVTFTPNTFVIVGQPKHGWWLPAGASTTLTSLGTNAPTTVGPISRNPATTSMLTSLQRIAYVTAASSNTTASVRSTAAQYWLGNAAGLGGFKVEFRCAISDAVINTTGHLFCGLTSATGAPSDAAPSTLTNILGIGCEASSAGAHLQAYGSGAVAQAATDLGASFPCDTTNVDIYDVVMTTPSQGTTVNYTVTRVNTGATSSSSWTGAQLPSNTTFLAPQVWRGTGANATASGVDLFGFFVETPN